MRAMSLHLFAGQIIASRLEMFDAALGPLESPRHQRLTLGFQSRAPKVAGHLDLIKGNGLKRIIGSLARHSPDHQSHAHDDLEMESAGQGKPTPI